MRTHKVTITIEPITRGTYPEAFTITGTLSDSCLWCIRESQEGTEFDISIENARGDVELSEAANRLRQITKPVA